MDDVTSRLRGLVDPEATPNMDRLRSRLNQRKRNRILGSLAAVFVVAAGAVGLAVNAQTDQGQEVATREPGFALAPTDGSTTTSLASEPEQCPDPELHPTYLPDGESSSQNPDHQLDPELGRSRSFVWWMGDQEPTDHEALFNAPAITLERVGHLDAKLPPLHEVSIRGVKGGAYWVGDPGVGPLVLLWDEPGLEVCTTHRLSFPNTHRIAELLGFEPRSDELADRLIEELVLIAESLQPKAQVSG